MMIVIPIIMVVPVGRETINRAGIPFLVMCSPYTIYADSNMVDMHAYFLDTLSLKKHIIFSDSLLVVADKKYCSETHKGRGIIIFFRVHNAQLARSRTIKAQTSLKFISVFFSIYFLIALSFQSSFAGADLLKDRFDLPKDEPWKITAKSISYRDKEKIYDAEGDVVISGGDQTLYAQNASYNMETGIVEVSGDVRLESAGDVFEGESGIFDLNKQTGKMINGNLFLKNNNFYLKGSHMEKLDEDTYLIKDCHLTTCDGEKPAWSITGSEVKVTIEGYGTVKHAAFRIREFPFIYVPYFIFPAKTKRQTGLLLPRADRSSKRGYEYIQPFFWAISDQTDATIFAQFMSRRGVRGGAEFRYVLSEGSKGTLMFDGFSDDKLDNGEDDLGHDWGYDDDLDGWKYEDEEDDYMRPNSDRYWFRMKADQKLPFGFTGKLDLDIVSDQDYLREFKSVYMGFEDSEEYYLKAFGREFDDYDDPIRVNTFKINNQWGSYSLNAEFRWYDNVINRRRDDIIDITLHKLPLIEFIGSKQQIFETPFYFDLESEYTHFYRDDYPLGSDRGHRVEIHPRLYLPMRFRNYFSIEPSFGVRETAWDLYHDVDRHDGINDDLHRRMYDATIDISSEVYKIFNVGFWGIDKIKHSIRPQVIYSYIPYVEQSECPYFDSFDRIAKENLLTYSLTSTLTSRSTQRTEFMNFAEEGLSDPQNANRSVSAFRESRTETRMKEVISTLPDEYSGPPDYSYHEFLRLKLEQSYNIDEKREDDPMLWSHPTEKRPFSSFSAELEFSPIRYFSLQADTEYEPYDGKFQEYNTAVKIRDDRGDRLFVEHRYSRDSVRSLYSNFSGKLYGPVSAYAEYERNLIIHESLSKIFGIIYRSQCWAIGLEYENDNDDHKYSINFSFMGLKEFDR